MNKGLRRGPVPPKWENQDELTTVVVMLPVFVTIQKNAARRMGLRQGGHLNGALRNRVSQELEHMGEYGYTNGAKIEQWYDEDLD